MISDMQKALLARFNRCSNSPREMQAFVKEVILSGLFDKFVNHMIADDYDDTKEYSIKALAVYEDVLYKCTTAVTIPEEFDPEKWTAVTVDELLQLKADLVDGKVPSSQLPSYVSNIVEVSSYNALPAQGASDTIYVTKDTGREYRWTGTTYIDVTSANNFFSVDVSNISTMGDLRTYVDGINNQGLHCFFDFSHFMSNAYVCTVLMFTQSSVNYCLIFDIINGRTYLNYNGYTDSETVSDYVGANEDNLIRVIKITDVNTTLGDISAMLEKINDFGHHVMFDVSTLNAGAYLCTIFIDGTDAKVLDIVSQKSVDVVYNANTLLAVVLSSMLALGSGHVFTDVVVNNWTSDSTYNAYPYKAEITCQGIKATSVVEVIFALAQATSGNYAPINVSGDGTVTIYGKVNTAITIPTIKEVL